MFHIDLNADLGETAAPWEHTPDRELLELVSSASVACGGHAGDAGTMNRIVVEAANRGVAVGAHPGYPDREGFGRRELGASPQEIARWVCEQLETLLGTAASVGVRVRYVKPHGAMYNRAARDRPLADAIAGAIRQTDASLAVLGLAGSALLDAAGSAGLRAVAEVYLHLRYAADGTLLPRALPGAVLGDPGEVARRAVRLVRDGRVAAGDGSSISVRAESCCVHGDTPQAAALLRAVRTAFAEQGISVAPFAP